MRVRSMWGKLISFVVVISIFMQCIPVSERSAKAWTGNRVSTFEELVEACKMNNTILLTEDIVFTSAIDVPEGRNITIKGDGHTMSVETPNLDEDGNLNVNPSDFSLFNITNKIVTMKFSDVIMIGGSKPAYVFSRFRFPFKKGMLMTLLVLQIFPSFVGMIAIRSEDRRVGKEC